MTRREGLAGGLIGPAMRTESRIVELAAGQHGLVTRAQLLASGLSRDAIRWRVRVGRLRPVQRGIYLVGPLEHPRMRERAAVLACGAGAVVSHRSAGHLWGVCEARGGPVEVSLPSGNRGRRPGVRPHRVRLRRDEVTALDGIPVTTPARTILDLAAQASFREVEQAVALAERCGLVGREELERIVARYPRRAGVRVLRAILGAAAGPALTRSEGEERLLALIRKGRLPEPELNVTVERFEVDFLWRRARLVVEVDGFAFHGSRVRFERDRQRDAALAAAGFRVMRVTWRQLASEPEALLVRLAQALAVGGPAEGRSRGLASGRGGSGIAREGPGRRPQRSRPAAEPPASGPDRRGRPLRPRAEPIRWSRAGTGAGVRDSGRRRPVPFDDAWASGGRGGERV